MDRNNIPKEKFAFVNAGQKISDQKFEDKPVGYFKDAWIRFRKSKASVIAAIIILCIILYSLLTVFLSGKIIGLIQRMPCKYLPREDDTL